MHIIPQPKKIARLEGNFSIKGSAVIYTDDAFVEQAKRFADLVKDSCDLSLEFTKDISQADIIFNRNEKYVEEQYYLMISDGILTVTSNSLSGCFYAVESLRCLFELDKKHEALTCENCYIEDAPKFAHRGLLVDVCRFFYGVETIKQIIDLMGRVKLNKLHLHLSDDQGFRLQIDKYPLLTTISSQRKGSEVVQNGKMFIDEVPQSGYFTKADIAEIVSYAKQHQIDVIPEIDIPGHAMAILAAYPQYACNPQQFEVRQKWGISKDILCAGNDQVYQFVKDILDEICEMFPYEYIHLGGDEAPKDRWCNCKLCKSRLSELKLQNFDQLQTYMTEQFRQYLAEKGKKIICWNDGVCDQTNAEIVSQAWQPFKEGEAVKRINRGRKTILSPFFKLYFDYPYALTPLQKTHKYNPLSGVNRKSVSNVLGVECAIWTERVTTAEKLFFQILPRLDAFSECAWGYKSPTFMQNVKEKVELYQSMGIPCKKSFKEGGLIKRQRTLKLWKNSDSNIELTRQKSKEE